MPTGFWLQSSHAQLLDHDHSKRRDRAGAGIKVPNDFRRGRRKGRR